MKNKIKLLFLSVFISASLYGQLSTEMKQCWYEKSIAGRGDSRLIKKVFEQTAQDQKITIGVIGGSITAGAAASVFEKTAYAPLVVEWFKTKFPKAEVKFVNAGIGATNSVFGVHRVDEDLLKYKPDFVIVEFSVNDIKEEKAKVAYEGLIRKILKSERKPAVLALGLMDEHGDNWQQYHAEVCKHYGIPYISYRDAIYPEVKNGNILWRSLSPDEVHPNDYGHRIISNLVINFLEGIYADKLPEALTSNIYENSYILPFSSIENKDWTLTPRGWRTTHKGKSLNFNVEASRISIMYNRTIDTKKAANVYVTVDGVKKKLNTFFEKGWGDYMYPEILVESGKSGSHKISFEYDDKDGKEFLLHNIQVTP